MKVGSRDSKSHIDGVTKISQVGGRRYSYYYWERHRSFRSRRTFHEIASSRSVLAVFDLLCAGAVIDFQ